MSFLLGVLGLVLIFATFAVAGSLFHQRLRVTSLGHGATVGMASYSFALIDQLGAPFFLSLLAAVVVASSWGALNALLSSRVRAERFAFATFALQVIWSQTIIVLDIGRGALGISGISRLPGTTIFGPAWSSVIWGLLALAVGHTAARLGARHPFSSAAEVVAASDEVARSLGVRRRSIRVSVGVLYGVAYGVAAVVLAASLTVVEPGLFDVRTSIVILAASLFAERQRTTTFAFLGAVVLVGLPQLLRLFALTAAGAAAAESVLAGLALTIVAWLQWRERESGTS